MSFRVETHLNVPVKGYMKGIDYDQAARYGIHKDENDKKVTICSVKQNGDELVIVKRIDTPKNWFYQIGLPQKGFYERVIVNRKEKSVAIDSFEHKYNVKEGPYVWKRDLFQNREDNPHKMMFVRHLLWVNQLRRMNAHMFHWWRTMRLRSKINEH